MSREIDAILRSRKIIVTAGTGGVGKTTLSAALAVRAALLGYKAVVITIDPAKRLATSLGLETLGDQPMDLTLQLQAAIEQARRDRPDLEKSPSQITGSFSAIMPDTRRTFEAFVESLSPNRAVVERILNNPIFRIFAKEFSGTNEYMAMQRLYSVYQRGDYDCIILDTPPSRNTLAFLDAPKLLARFFEEKLIRWLVLPANQFVSAGMRKALGILEKLTGSGFMTHLFDFAAALFEVRLTFAANLKRITELLESKEAGFLVVATPTPETAPELRHFIQSLKDHRFHFDGVALNRTLSYLRISDAEWDRARREREQGNGSLYEAFTVMDALQKREERASRELAGSGAILRSELPELARDVHSVADLFHVALALEHPASSSHRGVRH